MRQHLTYWYKNWLEEHHETKLLWVQRNRDGVHLDQVDFVLHRLGRVAWYDNQRSDEPVPVWVIAEHNSKSVRLPVISIERPDLGIRFVMRDNFHEWSVSVISERQLLCGLRGFDVTSSGCGFEGFPYDLRFGGFGQSNTRFSCSLGNAYDPYAFVREIMLHRIEGPR